MNNEQTIKVLKRAKQLASIAYDWDLGTDGKVEIDGQWVSCSELKEEFAKEIKRLKSQKGQG